MKTYTCPSCGQEDVRPIGVCTICLQSVCVRCGAKHSTLTGPVVTHSECFSKHPELVETSFKLFRFKKA